MPAPLPAPSKPVASRLVRLVHRLPVPVFVGAAFLVGLLLLVFSEPEKPRAPKGTPAAGNVALVRIDSSGANEVLRLESLLRDPAPLFLPTSLSTAHAVRADRILQRPGDSFRPFPPSFVYARGEGPVSLPPPVRVPTSAAQAFDTLQSDKPFIGLGQRELRTPALPPRAASIELRSASSGTSLATLELSALGVQSGLPWTPAEFLVCARPGGLAGKPSLQASSGVELIDQALERAIIEHWPELERRGRLTPGIYHLCVGP